MQNNKIFEESAAKSKEAAAKHIPALTVNKKCGLIPEQPCVDAVVRIGATLHPMEQTHFIKFIDCYVDNKWVSRVSLTPGVFAAAVFHLKATGAKIQVVELCNRHGYWMSEAALG
jgi:superoxide reductase